MANEGKEWFLNKYHKLHLGDVFEGYLASYMIGELKPSISFYKRISEDFIIGPERMVLIDDQKWICDSTIKLGIEAIHFKNAQQVSGVLVDLGYL